MQTEKPFGTPTKSIDALRIDEETIPRRAKGRSQSMSRGEEVEKRPNISNRHAWIFG